MADQDRTIPKSHQSPVADYREQRFCFTGQLTAVEAEIDEYETTPCEDCDEPAVFGDLCADHYLAARKAFFSRKYSVSPSGCWVWLGSVTTGGYGTMMFGSARILAHRFSWAVAHGRPIAEGMHVCHSCDNPPCVNPAHLWQATPRQNSVDAMTKGRLAKVMTPDTVRRIYALKRVGVWLDKDIARIVGVSPSTVHKLLSGKGWDHGAGQYQEINFPGCVDRLSSKANT